MNSILIIATFIVAFFMAFYTYRRGLKDGLNINNGAKAIEPVKTPANSLKEYLEQRKQNKVNDKMLEDVMNIMNYDPDKAVSK